MAATVVASKLATGDPEMMNAASFEIRMLTKSNIFNRICFVEAGAVHWLLCLLSSSDPSLQDNAVAALLNLSKHHSARTDIFESSGLSPLVHVTRYGHKLEAQQNAAAVLFYLCTVEECQKAIGEIPDAIPSLVELLKSGTFRGKKNAIVTIYGLLLFPGNHPKILAAGAVAVISDLLGADDEDLVADCVGVLAKIAERPEGTDAILNHSTAVPQIVHALRSSTCKSGTENCVSALLSLCKNDRVAALSLLEKTPLLMPSLYKVVADGSPQACKKARSLLNCIHQFSELGYFHCRRREFFVIPSFMCFDLELFGSLLRCTIFGTILSFLKSHVCLTMIHRCLFLISA
ncbi:hypothetical protein HPP92_019406 [Vanilla planifolia]|uniref:U-box domain-containing protein n=1 Tax=Vanilla planifolia TaxID=51239 RepID=A0A835Q9J0_VANPL|nr:hypothetical protein HPP92_019406 [Vanilla planifolia]